MFVAIPIELAIFEQRVDQQLKRQYRVDNKGPFDELRVRQSLFDKRRADLTATINDLRRQEAEWARVLDAEAVGRTGAGRTGVPGNGPAFQNAQSQQASVRQEFWKSVRI
jgi:hypothetical protein